MAGAGEGSYSEYQEKKKANHLGINIKKLAICHHTHTVHQGILGCHRELSGAQKDYFKF